MTLRFVFESPILSFGYCHNDRYGREYRRAAGIMLVYDIADRSSYDNLEKWWEEIRNSVSSDIVVMGAREPFPLKRLRALQVR
jgi:GTPase SAR1 family protein